MDAASLVDDLSVRRVLAEYCHAIDDGRFDDLVQLFTEEGTFVFGMLGASGRPELRAWFEEFQPIDQRGKHLTTNTVVDVDGDHARARSDFAFLGFADGGLSVTIAGRYEDELCRIDGRWQIHRREAIMLRRPR